MATQIDAKAKAIMLFSQVSNTNFGNATTVELLKKYSDRIVNIIEDNTINNTKTNQTVNNVVKQTIKQLWELDWTVAWGPALNYSINKKTGNYHTDNSMYVAKGIIHNKLLDSKPNKAVYVVAIAGTNALSTSEQLFEDINVKHTAKWDKTKPEHGNLSDGSKLGLATLLGKFAYKGKISNNAKLIDDFFDAEVKNYGQENMEIITCGHSLGGALSPLVALAIKEKYPDIHVSTYPTAGPTSGDDKFAQYLETTLGEGNYISVINTKDIVPMAWEQDTLRAIPSVYNNPDFHNIDGKNATFKTLSIPDFITKYADATQDLNYTRIAAKKEQKFDGIFESITVAYDDPNAFMEEAMLQHTSEYDKVFFDNDTAFIQNVREIIYYDTTL